MRGSLTLPEFVLPKPKLPRFGAMILELKTGRKRNGGLKRIKHTRKSPLSRSNSFLAQKHSPNQVWVFAGITAVFVTMSMPSRT